MGHKNNNPASGKAEPKPVKTALIVLEVAALVTIILVAVLVFRNRGAAKQPVAAVTTDYSYKVVQASTTQRLLPATTAIETDAAGSTVVVTDNPFFVTQPADNPGRSGLADPTGWSRAQILQTAADAVNRTKAYTGTLNVDHTESFVANVTSAQGVPLNLAQAMMRWVAKPVSETLVFNNGTTVNSEGETVPILLPKSGAFALSESGLTNASIALVDNQYSIHLSIVREQVGMTDVPIHNASSIGWLDAGSLDLSLLSIDSAFIDYQGSTIDLRVNADGYVTYAEYHIPLDCGGSGSGNGIFSSLSGSLTFDGEQKEIWRLHW